jgi:DNA-binding transcriptional ArsR family regulator
MTSSVDDDQQNRETSLTAASAEPRERVRLSRDVLFDLLRNSRRRQVMRYLGEHDHADIGELAEHIAAVENGTDPETLSSSERKRVYVSLYQSHLPKLAEADVVDYDKERGTVSRTPGADLLDQYVEPAADGSGQPVADPDRAFVLGGAVAVAVGIVVLAGAAGVPPVGGLPARPLAALAALTALALGAALLVQHRR